MRKGGDTEWAQVKWESPEPQEKIFLIGNKFTEYDRESPYVQAMVFLRQPDQPLADKYLEATVQYIAMYSKLIGPYPYKKFALVENFWESGYGMPSFTLLGPKIIRFPFILHSSYPHEILHNWWGNGVFVDYEKGNWCEGLTVYLADYLIKEQHGEGLEYRRTALQRYTDYVRGNKDFPLSEFRERHSAVTQAIGYDKAMMFFHMLRMELGDDVFVKGLQKFYQDNKFRYATYENLRVAFAAVSGKDLKTELDQWVKRPGVPELQVKDVNLKKEGKDYVLTALIQQVQPGTAYKLQISIVVHTERGTVETRTEMQDKELKLVLPLLNPPLRLDIDPEFDLIRRLNRDEIPASLSQAFGADKMLVLLPAKAREDLKDGYRQLAETWKASGGDEVEIKSDYDIDKLPADRAVWVLGWENRFRQQISSLISSRGVRISGNETNILSSRFDRKDWSAVFVVRNPENPDNAIVWLATGNMNAMPGLGRKLPHYAKYSYLVFQGDEPVNAAKGQWPGLSSPLSVLIPQEDGSLPKSTAWPYTKRKPLADLPDSGH